MHLRYGQDAVLKDGRDATFALMMEPVEKIDDAITDRHKQLIVAEMKKAAEAIALILKK